MDCVISLDPILDRLVDLIRSLFRLMRLSNQMPAEPKQTGSHGSAGETTDEELMQRYALKADTRAFETLLRRFRVELFGFFVRACRDRQAAEDLYQETFIRVIRSASAYSPTARFRTWLFTIAHNLLTDHYRRQSIRRIVTPFDRNDDEDGSDRDYPDQAGIAADKKVELLEYARALREILAELPAEQREVFLLRENAGLDFREAAGILGCSENTAKSRMRYALEKIRDEFSKRGLMPGKQVRG